MSIPLDRLYHYIEQIAQAIRRGDVVIYRFTPHGSKKIKDLWPLREIPWPKWPLAAQIYCYDQEPLNYQMYQDQQQDIWRYQEWGLESPKQNIRAFPGDIYDKCILIHSEQRSAEVEKYQKNQFISVYYWNHAMLARDWFRYAEHVDFNKAPKQKFLIYNRAWSGTREYRLKFTDLLVQHNLANHCHMRFNPVDQDTHYRNHVFTNLTFVPSCDNFERVFKPNNFDSTASADFVVEDYNNTEVEVVLETLFDDSRIQLTEKILRPIACGQPFILATTYQSLEYLRSYGFKTFDSVWDESYDNIQNPTERLQAIVELMLSLSTRSDLVEKTQSIVEHNRRRFFSKEFFNQVTQELSENLAQAFDELETTNTAQRFFEQRKALVFHDQARKFITGADSVAMRQDIAQVVKTARKYCVNAVPTSCQ